MSELRIVGVKYRKEGKIEPVSEQESEHNPIDECRAKWKHLEKEVASLLWSQCPPDMAGDFVRATMDFIKLNYGINATNKSLEVLAINFASSGKDNLVIDIASSVCSRHLLLKMHNESENDFNPFELEAEDMAEFELANNANEVLTETEAKETLKNWSSEKPLNEPLNIERTLPNEDIMKILKALDDHGIESDLAVLFGAGAVILHWQHLENVNAKTSVISMAGLSIGEEDISVGNRVVMNTVAERISFEPKVAFKIEDLGYSEEQVRTLVKIVKQKF